MKALQYTRIGSPPEVVEVATPEPAGGEVLLRVLAAGACHSDEFIMGLPEQAYVYGLPLTLGHEGVGVVEAVGPSVTGVQPGDEVAVYGPWGCGRCHTCATGAEQYCEVAAARGIQPPGLGAPGSMAEFMLVDDARHLVPLRGLSPTQAAPLTDAGLTPYHAIKPSLPKLVPGSTAVVIGVGGLGHLAIRMLRALSTCQVIALDLPDKLDFAREMGAHHALVSGEAAPAQVKELTDGRGATAVFDFVGLGPTTALSPQMVAALGDIVVVGVGDGTVPVGLFSLPFEVSVRAPYWGTIPELHEVLAMARSGALEVETETFGLDESPRVYERMHARTLRGRAVVVP